MQSDQLTGGHMVFVTPHGGGTGTEQLRLSPGPRVSWILTIG